MAMQKRFPVRFVDVFPRGCFAVSEVEAVGNFDAPAGADGTRPQQLDKETGLPLWSVSVLDADEEAGKKDKTVSIKIASQVQPTLPKNPTPFPFTPVEFTGLSALAYVDDGGGRPRVAWSFRASGVAAPGGPAAPAAGKGAGSSGS